MGEYKTQLKRGRVTATIEKTANGWKVTRQTPRTIWRERPKDEKHAFWLFWLFLNSNPKTIEECILWRI